MKNLFATTQTDFIQWMQRLGYAMTTIESYQRQLQTFLEWLNTIHIKELSEITPENLESYNQPAAGQRRPEAIRAAVSSAQIAFHPHSSRHGHPFCCFYRHAFCTRHTFCSLPEKGKEQTHYTNKNPACKTSPKLNNITASYSTARTVPYRTKTQAVP